LAKRAVAAVNQALVLRNWIAGAYIVEFEQNGEDRASYGARLLPRLSEDLGKRGHGGLGVSMLELARRFYQVYPQLGSCAPSPLLAGLSLPAKIGRFDDSVTTGHGISPSSAKMRRAADASGVKPLDAELILALSWSKIIELIRIDDPVKRAFYEGECLKGEWSKRQLQRQIGSLLYERTALSKSKTAVLRRARRQEPPSRVDELIRDPYVLEFVGLAERTSYTETELETALLDHLQGFLLELGVGFCFEARQKRLTLGNEHDYVDLVFYHRILRCHVLLDLKVRTFRHADVGQMNFYLNYYNQRVREYNDNPPVGIILCSDKDETKVQFATAGLDNKLFVSRYLVALPSAEQLARFVERDRANLQDGPGGARVPPSRAAKKERPGDKPGPV
jgi:predicted nuclease of restriction endonuclease-like (RecB) superfamily